MSNEHRLYIGENTSMQDIAKFIDSVLPLLRGGYLEVNTQKKRTPAQHRAAHQYFDDLADALNASGLDMKKVLKEGCDIPWNKDMVKKFLWGPVQKIMTGKDSTTKLTTEEVDEIFQVVSKRLADKFNVNVEFPNKDRGCPF